MDIVEYVFYGIILTIIVLIPIAAWLAIGIISEYPHGSDKQSQKLYREFNTLDERIENFLMDDRRDLQDYINLKKNTKRRV